MKSCSCEFSLICQLCFRFKKVCDLLFSTKKKPEPARFLSRKWNFLIKEINWNFGRDKNSNYDAAGRTDLWSLTSLISVMGSLKSTLSGPRAEVLQWERMASNFLYYFREGRPSCSYSANRKRLQRFIHLFSMFEMFSTWYYLSRLQTLIIVAGYRRDQPSQTAAAKTYYQSPVLSRRKRAQTRIVNKVVCLKTKIEFPCSEATLFWIQLEGTLGNWTISYFTIIIDY